MEKTVTHPSPSCEDRQAILDLIAAYSYAYDSQDLDGFVALFAEDAEWSVTWAGRPGVTLRGHDELRRDLGGRIRAHAAKGTKSRHYQTNTVLTLAGNGVVEGTTMVLVVYQSAGEKAPRPAHSGVYRDLFVKGASGRKFLKRTIDFDHE